MIRIALGLVVSALGVSAAAIAIGPNLFAGPRGEPLVMMAPDQPMVQAARYDGDACGPTLILEDPTGAEHSGARIVVFSLPTDSDDVAVAVEDFPRAPAAPRAVVLIFDEAGRLISADDSSSLEVAAGDCLEPSQPIQHNPI
jgi:hypothetical protein